MAEVPGAHCERIRSDLSAFADETLPSRRWELVGYHVAGCPGCRRELDQIRRVRRTLNTQQDSASTASLSLAQRLHGIAGEHSHAPLYMAGGPSCALPSKRRARTRRMLQSGMAVLTVMASVLVIAFLVAPEPPLISDAVKHAREQYSLSATASSVNEAVGAVLLAHERGAAFGSPHPQSPRATMGTSPLPMPRATAAAMLERAGPTHTGIQRVWISAGNGVYHATDVQVDEVAGEGSSLVVLDSTGHRFMSWFVPSGACCQSDEGPPWTFWKYRETDQVAGRWADVIEARDDEGRRVARWWVDCDDGLVLWWERYDRSGTPTIISGFTSLTMGEARLAEDHVEMVSMNPVSSSGAKGWCLGLEECPASLAGLPLVAHASSHVRGSRSMRMFYSDGFRGLSVVWSEGRLKGSKRVADHTAGFPEVAVWQAGDGVVSVGTNSTPELLLEANGQLPDEEQFELSVPDRIRRGLARLAGIN
ncbi:anti-sigma factor family protein [Tessaracoccus sp.]